MTTTLNQAGRYCNHLWSDGTYRFIEEVVYIPTPSTYYPTYAERTHTVDPSAVIDGVGDDASPWTSEQARTLAVAGNKVGIKSGVIVGIDPEAGGNSRFTPAFLPLNSGTVDNKIYFIAEHPAADPNTDPSDYTEFRSGATVAGSGWPAFGTLDNNYVEYIGFYTDETRSNNKGTNDSGPCTLWTAIGCGVHLCRIIGEDAPFDDNHNGIRIEGFEYGHISSNHIEGFKNNIVSSAINQSGITTYRTLHTIIEHNYFKDCGESVYIKGGYQYGNIARFNRIEGAVWNGMRILSLEPDPLDGDNRNQIYQNLFINCANDIELGYHGDRPLANNAVDIFNNTCYAQSADNSSFSLYIRDDVEVRGNTFRNNVVHVIGRKSYLGVESAAWNAADFTNYVNTDSNTYYGTAVFADGYNASDWNQADFATWKALTGADSASQIADPLFVDAANGDFRLQAGSPALNAGTDYTNVKGGGTSAPINHGVYISPDQSEIIGIKLNPLPFTALRTINFDGLIDGQSVVNGDTGEFTATSVDGKRFDECLAYKGFQGGYGTRASTTVKMDGRTSSCKLTIASGSDGDPAGGESGSTYGAFGGQIDFGSDSVSQGEEIWARIAIFIPSDFDFGTNIGGLKFLRMSQDESTGRVDLHVVNGDFDAGIEFAGLVDGSDQAGWGALSEIDASTESWKHTDRNLIRNSWNTVEIYVKPNSDNTISVRRTWINGQLVYEQNGSNQKWHYNGVWNNSTINSGSTLVTSSGELINFMLFTYWNGGSPINNECYVQSIDFHKNEETLTQTDEFGNKMMGIII